MLSIETQVTEHMRHHLGIGRSEARGRAVELLSTVRIPDPERALRAHPAQFSGGMRQRIAIAVALACEPRLLLADEPTTALDVTVQAGILRLLHRLRLERDLAVVVITHDLGVMSAVADRICVMYGGRTAEVGPRETVLTRPRHPYTRGLLDALPHPEGGPPPCGRSRAARRRSARCRTAARSIRAARSPSTPAGRTARSPFSSDPITGWPARPTRWRHAGSERVSALLEATGVAVEYHRTGAPPLRAVDHADLTLARGEILGLVGESGCGKSTLGRAVVGLQPTAAGEIRFDGRPVAPAGLRRRSPDMRGLQMVFQDPYASLNPRRLVGDQVGDGYLLGGTSKTEARRRAGELLERVGLPADAVKRYPHEFSGGQRQRIAIARTLAAEPELHHRRRADQRARRLGAGVGRQPAGGAGPRTGHGPGVHLARPVGGAADRRPHRGHVPGPRRRGRADPAGGGRSPPTRTPKRSSRRCPGRRRGRAAGRAAGGRARPLAAARRLPVPPALPGGPALVRARTTRRCASCGTAGRPPASWLANDLMEGHDVLAELTERFWAWRLATTPRSRDDIPGWSGPPVAAGVGRRHRRGGPALPGRDRERSGGRRAVGRPGRRGAAPAARLGDRAGALELDGPAELAARPWFYLDQTVGHIYDALLAPGPFDLARSADLVERLRWIPGTLDTARDNLDGTATREFAELALADSARRARTSSGPPSPCCCRTSTRPSATTPRRGGRGGGGGARPTGGPG